MSDELVWSYFLCDVCKHCRVQTGCLLGNDVGGWKVISDGQHPLDVCESYEPKEDE